MKRIAILVVLLSGFTLFTDCSLRGYAYAQTQTATPTPAPAPTQASAALKPPVITELQQTKLALYAEQLARLKEKVEPILELQKQVQDAIAAANPGWHWQYDRASGHAFLEPDNDTGTPNNAQPQQAPAYKPLTPPAVPKS